MDPQQLQPHVTKEEHREVKKQVTSLSKSLPAFIFFTLMIGGLMYWQYSTLSKRLSLVEHRVVDLQSEVHEVGEIVGEPAPAPAAPRDEEAEQAAADWDAAVARLPQCGEGMDAPGKLPSDADLATLGLTELLAEGFMPVDFCIEKSGGIIGGIMAKAELTQVSPAAPEPVCEDRCDRVVFVSGEAASSQLLIKKSEHRLGIHAEAYSQHCRIDGMVPGAPMTSDLMYLVCGSGEAGGYSHWYKYSFADDSLAVVQQLVDAEKNTYDVKDPAAMEFFRLKKNPEPAQ